jgi:hypothetical protein
MVKEKKKSFEKLTRHSLKENYVNNFNKLCDTSNFVIVWIWMVCSVVSACVESYIGYVLNIS